MCLTCGVDGVVCGCLVGHLHKLLVKLLEGAVGFACGTFVFENLVDGKA